MCGIGLIVGGGASSVARVERMIDALSHRGPDARDVVDVTGCTLGHARLSILDLVSGAQPMADGARRYAITFNGEIYNYRDLRDALAAEGCQFRTRSDTEVVLAAYTRWGAAALDRLRGMFAFAIWDAQERVLFAARDIFGEKPLYHATAPGGAFLIASEIKALLASGLVSAAPDLESLDAYLAFGYVPPTASAYRAVTPLPPAHWLRWEAGRLEVHRYWTPRFEDREIGIDEAGETLLGLLRRAVARQMVADVPVGAFLSGGLDSSSIVALMQAQHERPVKTFAVGFGEEINELPYARAVAERLGTEHHEVDLGSPAVAVTLERLAQVHDEPFADSSSIPTYLISAFARQHVKVVLSGDGGDEMFAGYGWYRILRQSEHLRATRIEWAILRLLSRAVHERSVALHRRSVAVGLSARWSDMWLRAAMNQVYIPARRRRALWDANRSGAPSFDIARGDVAGHDVHGLNRAFYYDLTTYLPGDILVKVDRASMAHGLETRAPFLDRDVAEFALSLPARLKVDSQRTKIVLRQACERFWPEQVRSRGKHGFGAPYRRWLRRPDVRALSARVFREGGALRSLLPGTPASPSEDSYETWMLLTLGLWLERQPVAA
jgi:asparagine synthase (glutamine-hydrolysing)